MSRGRLLPLCLAGAVAVAVAGVVLVAAPAQAATHTLRGVVHDAAGAPVAGLGVSYAFGTSQPLETTAGDGSYEIAVPDGEEAQLLLQGAYQGARLIALTQKFVMSGDRTEDATLPVGAVARLTIDDGEGVPLAGATVSAERFALTPTSGGLDLVSRLDGSDCSSDAAGHCDLSALRGGTIQYFDVTPPGSSAAIRLDGMETPDAVNEKTLVVSQPVVSGHVRTDSGTPVAGATVRLVHGTTAETATTDPDGGFSVTSSQGGDAVLTVDGTVTDGGRSAQFSVTTSSFSLSGTRTEDLTLPPLSTLAIHVRDSLGAPVAGARVTLEGAGSERTGATPTGLAYTATTSPSSGSQTVCTQTSAAGVCEVTVWRGGMSPAYHVTPPGGSWQGFPGTATDDDPTTVTARLVGYAPVASAGTRPGTTLVTTPRDSGADITALTASPTELPDGLEPIVGRIAYRVALPVGATATTLSFAFPVRPDALVAVDADGHVSDVTSGSSWGDGLEWGVTDGSPGDTDGVVNGVVTGSIIPVLRAPLVVETSSLPGAAKGHPYVARLVGSGPVPPYTWRISAGALPVGLGLDPDGTISGTPTTLGTSTFEVQMRDSTGSKFVGTRTLSLTVATLAVVTTSVPDAWAGGAYSTRLQCAGCSLPAWKVVSGSLPPGLALGSGGTISGTPTAAGTYRFTVTARAGGVTSPPQDLSIVVHPMEIATPSLPDAPVGASYTQKLTTLGGKATLVWSVAGGALPPGLTLSPSGTLSGRPTTVGSYPVTIKVVDASSPKQVATRSFVLVVAPMEVTTSALPTARKGTWYSTLLVASGGKPTLVWSVAGGSLPSGLTLAAGGRISGTPKATGTWTFTVQVADASTPKNTATRTLSITVA